MPIVEKEAKTVTERLQLKSLKKAYKEDMQAKHGGNWRKEVNKTVAVWCC